MKIEIDEYRARKIVNVHKHVDGPWFWTKYSAHPYVGCRSGCEFCYSRGSRYLGRRDPERFDTLIRVKVNAAERLRRELPRLEREIVSLGDWQEPVERRYRLSRAMLEVACELRFPVLVNERSSLVTRDLDLLVEIDRRSWAGVAFSLSNVDPHLKHAFEPRSPGVRRRLRAMQDVARAGLLVGASLMPVIPFAGDDDAHLDDTVRAVADHGGTFVLVGGLTMDGIQAERTLEASRRFDPALERSFRELYSWPEGGRPSYGPPRRYAARLGRRVRELCAKHGLADRMPRHVAPGPLATNKRIAERLFLETWDLELREADDHHVWAYRKAAWRVDELRESLEEAFRTRGEPGLRELPGVGERLASKIAGWLREDGYAECSERH